MALIVYILCDAVAALVAFVLPEGPWTPYVPLMVAYHLFLLYLVLATAFLGEEKVGISMSIPMTVITHAAFLGALIGVVMGRHYVPLFALVKYAVPGLAPFEAKWLFEGARKAQRAEEEPPLPAAPMEEYNEFLEYLRQKERKFLQPGRSIRKEFLAWQAHRKKQRARE